MTKTRVSNRLIVVACVVPNGVGAGKKARVQFSNGILTRVDVQVAGKWKSN